MSVPYVVTGVTIQEVYPRLEIRELQEKHPEQFTLFVLAWEEIRKPNYRPTPSQYEHIAGIHGMPYVRWPGDPDETVQTTRGPWLGYCSHASILFPTWHRPYMMLMEQSITEAAQGIAGKFASEEHPGDADKWIMAARQLRLAFWDWTDPRTGSEGIPKVLTDKTLSLLMPKGVYKHYGSNPFAFHKFNNPIEGFNDRLEYKNIEDSSNRVNKPDTMAYYKQWDRTYRWPNPTPVNVVEDIDVMNAGLKTDTLGGWRDLTSEVAALFGFPMDIPAELHANAWDQFSNTRFQSSRPDKDPQKPSHSPFNWHIPPIEQPHNWVHIMTGGIGHMCDADTAAFDPMFYFHHSNIDRILAFWEHIYPDYVAGTDGYLDIDGMTRQPFNQVNGTFVKPDPETVDDATPLAPFRKADYTYWTSKDTQTLHFNPDSSESVRNKYYTYSPIDGVDLNPKTPPTPEERAKQRLILQKHFQYNPIKAVTQAPQVKHRLFTEVVPYGGGIQSTEFQAVENYRQFVIEASLSQSHITGSYMLKIFMTSKGHEIYVGSIHVLGRGKSTSCGNCQARRAAGTRVQGVITVPHEVIVSVLQGLLLSTPEASDEDAITAIKGSICPRLVLPSGLVHSEPLSERSDPSNKNLEYLSEGAEPSICLLSCDVYQATGTLSSGLQPESLESPFDFHDWKNHGILDMYRGQWIKRVTETS